MGLADPVGARSRANSLYEEGIAHFDAGRLEESERCFRATVWHAGDFAEAHVNLGNVLMDQSKSEEALASYRQALALRPASSEIHLNIGLALRALRRFDEAIESYRNALSGGEFDAEVYCNLGAAYMDMGRLEDAASSLRAGIAVGSRRGPTYHQLANVLMRLGDSSGAIAAYAHAVRFAPDSAPAYSGLMFSMLYSDAYQAAQIKDAAKQFSATFEAPLRAQIAPYDNSPDPARRLRVGYLSGDFRDHSVAYFIEPVLDHHDDSVVDVIAYSTNPNEDEVTARLRASVTHWNTCVKVSDVELADRIRHDEIDILVDLAGHTNGGRMLTLARKPAPIQVSWVGSPVESGLRSIDYFLTDVHASPLPERFVGAKSTEYEASEQGFFRLPKVFSVYRPPEDAPPVQPTPALKLRRVTLGSFNKLAKVSDRTVAVWSRILQRDPSTVLLLKDGAFSEASVRTRIAERFAAHGIDESRLKMVARIPGKMAHLQMYGEVDIALDPFPYCGVTTSCEAMWMGVPVVSLAGNTFVSRMGVTLLNAVGHLEWLRASEEDYVDGVLALAADISTLNAQRMRLREEMEASPLRNERQFTRDLEAAYRTMWRTWCASRV